MASAPYKAEAGPLITSIFFIAPVFISIKALLLKRPLVLIGIPSSKYKYNPFKEIGCLMAIMCCSLPILGMYTPLTVFNKNSIRVGFILSIDSLEITDMAIGDSLLFS